MRRRARHVDEQMDAADADPAALRRSLAFIRRVNARLRYNHATARAVDGLGGGSVLDVCCGSADFAAFANNPYVGLDFHPTTLDIARAWQPDATLVRGDALRLPFGDGSFDVAVCQMALHHFDAADATTILKELDRVSRRGWVVADLLRRRRALAWITLFTLFSEPMVKHDARTSVRQAWRRREVEALCRDARVTATYRQTFGHRFLLISA